MCVLKAKCQVCRVVYFAFYLDFLFQVSLSLSHCLSVYFALSLSVGWDFGGVTKREKRSRVNTVVQNFHYLASPLVTPVATIFCRKVFTQAV